MSEERDQALAAFFVGPTGLGRSAGDAVAMTSDAMECLEQVLEDAGELDQDAELAARAESGAFVYDAAILLGRSCIDALSGLVISREVDLVAPRLAALPEESPPLDDSWQRSASPYRSLATVALAQRGRLADLSEQPNQLYRHLHEAIALAADVAAWSAWTQLGEN